MIQFYFLIIYCKYLQYLILQIYTCWCTVEIQINLIINRKELLFYIICALIFMHNIYIYTFICTYTCICNGPHQSTVSPIPGRIQDMHVSSQCWSRRVLKNNAMVKKRGVSVLNMLVYYILGKYDMYIRYRDHPCHIRYKYVFIDLDMYLTYHPE